MRGSSSSGARMSGPSPAMRWSPRARASVRSSSTGPSNSTTSCVAAADHEPRPARAAAPARPALVRAPGPGHPQVRVQRQAALEAQEEVLAEGVHARDGAAGEALGPAVARGARMRRADRVRHVALEHRADPVRRVVDGVAFGHALWERSRSGYVAHHGGGPRTHRRRRERPARRRRAVRRRPDGVQRGARCRGRRRAARGRGGGGGRRRVVPRARGARRPARRGHRLGRRRGAARLRRRRRARAPHRGARDGPAAVADDGRRRRHHGDRPAPRARARPVLPARPRGGRDLADRRERRHERRRAALLQVRRHRRLGDRTRGGARVRRDRARSAASRARTSPGTTCAACSSGPRGRSASSRRSGCG